MKHAFVDKHAYGNSRIHRLSTPVKMVVSLALIIGLISTPAVSWLYGICLGLLFMLIYLAELPLLAILNKMLIILPLALFVVVFNILLNGFSQASLYVAVKTCCCLLTVVILISTTKVHEILKVLKAWHLPNILLLILSFLYRYFFLLIDEFCKMEQALKFRNMGLGRWQTVRLLAHISGTMFLKTYERAERVYSAMIMRGYNGENL